MFSENFYKFTLWIFFLYERQSWRSKGLSPLGENRVDKVSKLTPWARYSAMLFLEHNWFVEDQLPWSKIILLEIFWAMTNESWSKNGCLNQKRPFLGASEKVAGAGLEPTTSGLWARRAATALPRVNNSRILFYHFQIIRSRRLFKQ